MKNLIALVSLGLTASLSATVTINLSAGALKNSSSGLLTSTNTLWALVEDTNEDLALPGGLGLNESLTPGDSASAFAAFAGQSISVGTVLGGDRVFYVGEGLGTQSEVGNFGAAVELDFGSNPVVTGRNFAVYWFPGLSLASNVVSGAPFQVGGIHETNVTGAGVGTTIPADPSTAAVDLSSADYFGGPLDNTRTTAINAVPEASTSLLALLGLGLLRRRR